MPGRAMSRSTTSGLSTPSTPTPVIQRGTQAIATHLRDAAVPRAAERQVRSGCAPIVGRPIAGLAEEVGALTAMRLMHDGRLASVAHVASGGMSRAQEEAASVMMVSSVASTSRATRCRPDVEYRASIAVGLMVASLVTLPSS